MAARPLNRAQRIAFIEQTLFRSAEGLRAVEVADAAGVDRRTIYRDLLEMTKMGIPVVQKDGRFFINRDYHSTSVRLSVNEALALFAAARLWTRKAEHVTPYSVSALAKIGAALPEPLSSHVSAMVDMLRGIPIDRHFVQVLDVLVRGWVEQRQTRLWTTDDPDSEVHSRLFQPYFIESALNGGFYAVGWDENTQSIQAFRLETIKRAKLLSETYTIPADFDRRIYLETAWETLFGETARTKVVLAFPSSMVALVRERMVHPGQRVEVLDDHRVMLTVYVQHWQDIVAWVRSWGADVEALEPEGLRRALATDAARMAEVYGAARHSR